MTSFLLQCIVVFGCIFVGARIGGIGLGIAGGFGLSILTFVFGLKPTAPPVTILLIIIYVITLVSVLQTAGGLDYLVAIAERIIKRHPNQITIIAPMVAYVFTLFTGTAYVAISLFPIVVETAIGANVRPERPMSMTLIASKLGITGSPMSAATMAMLAILSPFGFSLIDIMIVSIPAGIVGTFIGSLFVYKRGYELLEDPEYLQRLKQGLIEPSHAKEYDFAKVPTTTRISVWIFLFAIFMIVFVGIFKSYLPSWTIGEKVVTLSVPQALQMLLFGAAFIIVVVCRLKTAAIVNSSVFRYGMVGVVAIFGIAWMTDTFFAVNKMFFIDACSAVVQAYPGIYGVVLFFMSALLFSQGATIPAFMPLGLTLGLTPVTLLGLFPAVNGNYFFPATGNVVAAVAFDRTGTTKIGKYVLNHSFMLPGLIGTFSMTVVCMALCYVIY